MNSLFVSALFIASFITHNTVKEKHNYILIENVSIISMNPEDKTITLGSILIEDSVIINVGKKSSFTIPEKTKIINGKGKFVIPGLWDTHVHFYKTTRQSIPSFLKYGITSTRDMGGDADTLKAIISDIKAGKIDGPRIMFCGPTFESPQWMDWVIKNRKVDDTASEDYSKSRLVPQNKADVRRMIDSLVRLGVDFIKMRNYKDAEVYWALAEAARERGIRFYGHTPTNNVDQIAVANFGQSSFEHGWYPSLSGLSDSMANKTIEAFKKNNCALVPTITTWAHNGFMPFAKMDSLLNGIDGIRDKEVDNLPPALLKEWQLQFDIRKKENNNIKGWNRNVLIGMCNDTKRFFKAGIKVMAGSDVTSLLVFPGRSLHEELAYFVELVGMTPYEALESATRTPSVFLGYKNRGTIEKGKLADLVLLDNNPLVDIHNSTSINTVIKNGSVLKFK